MIVTNEKVLAFIEDFEKGGGEAKELTELDQVSLYSLTAFFNTDLHFRAYLNSCLELYVNAVVSKSMGKFVNKFGEFLREMEEVKNE